VNRLTWHLAYVTPGDWRVIQVTPGRFCRPPCDLDHNGVGSSRSWASSTCIA